MIYWMWEKKPSVIILIIILLYCVEILRPRHTALRGVNIKALLQARIPDRHEEDLRSNTTLPHLGFSPACSLGENGDHFLVKRVGVRRPPSASR